jgi:iron complex transport system substrate-binding protein
MRKATLHTMLFAALPAVVAALSLFHPAVTRNPKSSGSVAGGGRVMILPVILSGYATVGNGVKQVSGVSRPALEWAQDGLFDRIYPEIQRLPVTGYTVFPDPEQILFLHPDALFAYAGQADAVKQTGFPGLIEIRMPVRNMKKFYLLLGKTSGESGRAAELLARYSAKLTVLRKLIARTRTHKVRVECLNIYNGQWWTTSNVHYITRKVELAGAVNLSADIKFTSEADMEQLLVMDPDVILLVSSPDEKTTLRDIAGRRGFQALRAVREHRLYRLPAHTFLNDPVEDPLLIDWMAEIFHPEVMPRRLRQEYRECYRDLYHYKISEDEIDRAIYLPENMRSAGYERFVREADKPR